MIMTHVVKIFEPIPIRKNKSTKRDFKDFHIDTSKYRDNKNKVVGFYHKSQKNTSTSTGGG